MVDDAPMTIQLAALAATGVIWSVALLLRSVVHYTRTGPMMSKEVLREYPLYSVYALLRLSVWVFVVAIYAAIPGMILGWGLNMATGVSSFAMVLSICMVSTVVMALYQFAKHLLYIPSGVVASLSYRVTRFYGLWALLSPERLSALRNAFWFLFSVITLWTFLLASAQGESLDSLAVLVSSAIFVLIAAFVGEEGEPQPARTGYSNAAQPNVIMIGSDTLRADRLGAAGYKRALTPTLDALAKAGVQFTNCYVPMARTAPSLLSLLTGMWPKTHGVDENFVVKGAFSATRHSLAYRFQAQGYRTAVCSDWSGSDLGKFELGYKEKQLPEDQWNLKYLLRQGPKDIRLFLSLFSHNRIGRHCLPEIYYMAGKPLTSCIGRQARRKISTFARRNEPFFLTVFMATTHPPFGSEYPFYKYHTNGDYQGDSKFSMVGLTTANEIVNQQGRGKECFDTQQIEDLYDGCVQNFDHELSKMLKHLELCGLDDNTLVVVFSDHGMDFFEHETWGQGNTVNGDYSAKVPLIFSGAGIKAHGVVDQVVRSIDVAPTIAELAGIDALNGSDGESFSSYLVTGDWSGAERPAYFETGIWLTRPPGQDAGHLGYPNVLELLEVPDRGIGALAIKQRYVADVERARDRMVRLGRWKLTYEPTDSGAVECLFDLERDPQCLQDVLADNPDAYKRCKQVLDQWIG